MKTYSYKIMTETGWSKRGIRVTAENSKEAFQKATEIYKNKGYTIPMLLKWKYV